MDRLIRFFIFLPLVSLVLGIIPTDRIQIQGETSFLQTLVETDDESKQNTVDEPPFDFSSLREIQSLFRLPFAELHLEHASLPQQIARLSPLLLDLPPPVIL